jgi:hypothetical protein
VAQCVDVKEVLRFILYFTWCEINITLQEENTRLLRVFVNRRLERTCGAKIKGCTAKGKNYTTRN